MGSPHTSSPLDYPDPPVPHCAGLDCALTPLTPTQKAMLLPCPTPRMNEVLVCISAPVSASLLHVTATYVDLCKIFFHSEDFVHETMIRLSTPPPAFSTILQYYCTTLLHDDCAIYDPPPDPPGVCDTPYHFGHGNII